MLPFVCQDEKWRAPIMQSTFVSPCLVTYLKALVGLPNCLSVPHFNTSLRRHTEHSKHIAVREPDCTSARQSSSAGNLCLL